MTIEEINFLVLALLLGVGLIIYGAWFKAFLIWRKDKKLKEWYARNKGYNNDACKESQEEKIKSTYPRGYRSCMEMDW